jgi:hypothetical protein
MAVAVVGSTITTVVIHGRPVAAVEVCSLLVVWEATATIIGAVQGSLMGVAAFKPD